ncbi:MAG TPA: hypothetical protein EYP21_08625 [Syntrophaceae bacterium]|nr:hypothetical protein [Syntrophaceae bacterium]
MRLTREEKEKRLWGMVASWHRQGFSRTRMYEALKGTELGMRKKEFLAFSARVIGEEQKADRYKFIPDIYKPEKRDWISRPWDLKQKYLLEYKYRVIDTATGEKREVMLSEYTTRLRSKKKMLDAGTASFTEKQRSGEYRHVVRDTDTLLAVDFVVVVSAKER